MQSGGKWGIGLVAAVFGLIVLLTLAMVFGAAAATGTVRGACSAGSGSVGGGNVTAGGAQVDSEGTTIAHTVVKVVQQRHLPKRAAVIVLAAGMVESDLKNVSGGDRDSAGFLQQRPSQGWGSAADVTNPAKATGKFLDHLVGIKRWQSMPPGQAEQAVQASAFPDRYAPKEGPAKKLVAKYWKGPDNPSSPSGKPVGKPAGKLKQASASLSQGCGDQDQGGGADAGGSGEGKQTKLPKNFRPPKNPKLAKVVAFALKQVGKPYRWGAKGPDAFDCSGLTLGAWSAGGVSIPAGTVNQKNTGHAVAGLGQLRAGDLVFIPGSEGSPSNPRHVGIAIGHGLLVDAYDTKTGVITEKVNSWASKVTTIRRPT